MFSFLHLGRPPSKGAFSGQNPIKVGVPLQDEGLVPAFDLGFELDILVSGDDGPGLGRSYGHRKRFYLSRVLVSAALVIDTTCT